MNRFAGANEGFEKTTFERSGDEVAMGGLEDTRAGGAMGNGDNGKSAASDEECYDDAKAVIPKLVETLGPAEPSFASHHQFPRTVVLAKGIEFGRFKKFSDDLRRVGGNFDPIDLEDEVSRIVGEG